MSYRLSFAIQLFAQMIAHSTELLIILVLFSRVTSLGGFAVHEVLFMYAFAGIGFGLAQLIGGPLNELPNFIRKGEFDVLLIRPLSTLAQLISADIQLRHIGRVIGPIGLLGYLLSTVDINWSVAKVILLIITPICGAMIIGSLWVVAVSTTFWLVEARELANVVTYGSALFTAYPVTVFSGWLRTFLGFIVPGAFVAYYPTLELLDRVDPLGVGHIVGWLAPLFAVLAVFVAGAVWRFAVRHYRGTGS